MTRTAPETHRRRSVLLLGSSAVLGALTACGGDDPTDEETTVAMSPLEPTEAREVAEDLLENAQAALDETFPSLVWEDSAAEGSDPVDGGCRLTLPARRCETYLGQDPADHERIESALTSALEAQGLPAAPSPTGGTGGWLTTSSSGEGITLRFRSKGFTELSVHVDVAADCADVT